VPTYRVVGPCGLEVYATDRDPESAAAAWGTRRAQAGRLDRLTFDVVVHDAWGGATRCRVDLEVTAHASRAEDKRAS
jgi:hypothetical protein